MTKQKIVIKVTMSDAKSRSQAMVLAAKAHGVSSMGITGDSKGRLEVVSATTLIPSACLAKCLRKKLGHAEILQVEEVKEKKPTEKKPEEPMAVHPTPPCWCTCLHASPIVVCEEPSSCNIM